MMQKHFFQLVDGGKKKITESNNVNLLQRKCRIERPLIPNHEPEDDGLVCADLWFVFSLARCSLSWSLFVIVFFLFVRIFLVEMRDSLQVETMSWRHRMLDIFVTCYISFPSVCQSSPKSLFSHFCVLAFRLIFLLASSTTSVFL